MVFVVICNITFYCVYNSDLFCFFLECYGCNFWRDIRAYVMHWISSIRWQNDSPKISVRTGKYTIIIHLSSLYYHNKKNCSTITHTNPAQESYQFFTQECLFCNIRYLLYICHWVKFYLVLSFSVTIIGGIVFLIFAFSALFFDPNMA